MQYRLFMTDTIRLPLLAALLISGNADAIDIPDNLKKENLAAWCIVPFDASKRGPEARAQMLKELGLIRCAYDWRAQHVKEFEEEILQYKKHGIEFFSFWGGHEEAFKLFQKHKIHPQVWRTLPSPRKATQAERVEAAADAMEPLAKRTSEIGCKFGLYNHGGWGGEPENLVAVCRELRKRGHHHVGIVYNWHHGHGHIEDWAESLALMQPHLHCLNLNGMNTGAQPKILAVGRGQHDKAMLKILIESGYDGPVGILDHQNHLDAKESLQDNLDGLEWLKKEIIKPGSGGTKPQPKAKSKTASAPRSVAKPVASLDTAFGRALTGGLVVAGKPEWREPPITVECRVKLVDAKSYNILIASDTKASKAHWEIFTMPRSGKLRAYLPGADPDHVNSNISITDNQWHAVAMQYAAGQVSLWVDGRKVADQIIKLKPDRKIVPGGLAFARLVNRTLRMSGAIDEVRIRKGIHSDLGQVSKKPFPSGAKGELGLWNFNDLDAIKKTESKPRASLPFPRQPLDGNNPWFREHINRDRLYDFYAKQAIHYGGIKSDAVPKILPQYPGIDAGDYGHWGNQNDKDTWQDDRVHRIKYGSMVSGVFRGNGKTIPRAVCVSLNENVHAVFDEEALRFEMAWQGEPPQWSEVRHGFIRGITIGKGNAIPINDPAVITESARFIGIYRPGDKVHFAIRENGAVGFRHAVFADGEITVTQTTRPEDTVSQWPQRLATRGEMGHGRPYAYDTLTLPYKNPWNALFFVSGVDFLSANRLAICTIHGDAWLCDVSGPMLSSLSWKRFAAGLHQPLGLKVVNGTIHVMCRDMIVALHDRNNDDEADYYENVYNAHKTSAGGHDYVTGLQRDKAGRWYFASGNQGIIRGHRNEATVLGTGLRNPNGLAISPDGEVILSNVQEGNWTPASAILDISRGGHFGAGGPKESPRGYVPPMLYLPRGTDHSSGGQTYIDSDRWGPVRRNWIHYSMGAATHFLVLREVIDGESQAAAVALPGEFASGAHRGRFSPFDGQLYVAASQGWANYGVKDGALQRVRFTGGDYPYPISFESRDNGILLTFGEAPSSELLEKEKWFAQHWNYRYGPTYGSAEYSVTDPAQTGHDRLDIRSIQRIGQSKGLFLEIPQLRPVNQLHLHFNGSPRIELFATLHRLGRPFTNFPGYQRIAKTWGADQSIVKLNANDPKFLMTACTACHHREQNVVGPPLREIRTRYAGNPDGIVKWAMNPQNENPQLPPMPSFSFLGPKKLRIIAEHILAN